MLKLTLHPGSYDWEFIPVAGGNFRDAGTGDVPLTVASACAGVCALRRRSARAGAARPLA